MGNNRSPAVIIAGAGPVGLLLGNFLGKAGVPALMLEKEKAVPPGSRAIGVTPSSLALLAVLGLDELFIRAGVKVTRAVIHGERRILGEVRFDALPGAYPFFLSLPQETIAKLLEANLRRYPGIRLLRGREVTDVAAADDGAVVTWTEAGGRGRSSRTGWVCACDGKHSLIRARARLAYPGGRYPYIYLMGEFKDETGWGSDAYFFFTPRGPVESFPLPGGVRRWVAGTKEYEPKPPAGFLADLIRQRIRVRLNPPARAEESPFTAEHYLASAYARGRILLCGDAAHVMSPIGGRGMNTGFGDAWSCAAVLRHALRHPEHYPQAARRYERIRRKAESIWARRDAQLMRVESIRGAAPSGLRNAAVQAVLCLFPRGVARYFGC